MNHDELPFPMAPLAEPGAPLTLDCSDCPDRGTDDACEDCVVRYLVDRDLAGGCTAVEEPERRAIRVLAEAGLLAEVVPLRRVS